MGAINFYGGTWLGGGSGLCIDPEPENFCTNCGMFDDECTCDNPNYEPYYGDIKELYELCEKYLYKIQDYVIDKCKDKYVVLKYKGKDKIYRLERVLKRIDGYYDYFINLKAGYYSGFQIFSTSSDFSVEWRMWDYSDEDEYMFEEEREHIANVVNQVLSEIEVSELWDILEN